ncbi:MAG: NYN domain-containing protein [Candidatus Omnitrophota bacterium]
MKTVLIVDGYNAINAVPETKKLLKENLLSARSRIIMLTSEYARSSGYITDFCVVFDGQDRYRHLEKIYLSSSSKQTFSRTGQGDEKIIETVRQYSLMSGVRVVVASNDNYVRNNARGYGASLLRSEVLSPAVSGKKKSERGSSRKNGAKEISPEVKAKINKEYKKELGL